MKVILDNRIRLPPETVRVLGKQAVEELMLRCTHENPDHAKWLRHRGGFKPKEWIKTWRREDGGGLSFPRGAFDPEELIGMGLSIENRMVSAPCRTREWLGPEPWAFQTRLGDSFLRGGPGIWNSKPGSGKTDATLQLLARLGQKALVTVPKDAVFTQWVERVEQNLGFRPGIVKAGKMDLEPDIVIASQRTLLPVLAQVVRWFGVFVGDEVQTFGSKTFEQTIDAVPARFRLGVSGDERRADGKEFLIYDQFGRGVEHVSEQELYDSGIIVDVEVRVVLTEFRADWYKDLPGHVPGDDLAYGQKLARHRFQNYSRLLDEISADVERNELAIKTVKRCLDEGEQVAVLCGRRDHCMRVEAMASDFVSTARLMGDDKDFASERERFARGDARVAVGTYGKVGVGFESHRGLARGVLASPVVSNEKGEMQLNQFLGRFARSDAGKLKAVVFYLHDHHVFGAKPVQLLARWARNVSVEGPGGIESAASWLKNAKTPRRIRAERHTPAAESEPLFGRSSAPRAVTGWGGRKRRI